MLTRVRPRPNLSGLASYWRFEETSGSASDDVGGQTLTAANAPGTGVGKIINARTYSSASSQALTAADSTTLRTFGTPFTWAGWFLATSGGVIQHILCKGTSSGTTPEYRLRLNSNTLQFIIADGTNAYTAATPSFGIGMIGTWHFAAAWWDGSGISVQCDMSPPVRVPAVQNNGTNAFAFGRSGATGVQFWTGSLDEWGLWKGRNLAQSDLSWLYNRGYGRTFSDIRPFT